MSVSFPATVWDGDSATRDSDDGVRRAPDWRDWDRNIQEMAATQRALKGVADNATLHTVGAVTSKSGLGVLELGTGAIHKSVFTFTAMSMASTDGAGGSDGAWGTQNLYTFPVGHIAVLASHLVFPLGKIAAVTGTGAGFSETADLEIGVGSVASANATAWGLENGTQEDIVDALDVDLTSATSDAIESAAQASVAVYDGTSGAIVARMNFRTLGADDHGGTADALLLTGVLTLLWSNLGDN